MYLTDCSITRNVTDPNVTGRDKRARGWVGGGIFFFFFLKSNTVRCARTSAMTGTCGCCTQQESLRVSKERNLVLVHCSQPTRWHSRKRLMFLCTESLSAKSTICGCTICRQRDYSVGVQSVGKETTDNVGVQSVV